MTVMLTQMVTTFTECVCLNVKVQRRVSGDDVHTEIAFGGHSLRLRSFDVTNVKLYTMCSKR